MEDKTLFSVNLHDGNVAVHVEINGEEDKFAIALAFHNLVQRIPDIGAMIGFLLTMKDDKHFQKILEAATFEIPDFNELLK